jgi:IS5 family transposase
MRQIITPQLPLMQEVIDHEHSHEYQMINEIFDQNSEIERLIYHDITRPGQDPHNGRPGLTAEQLLRILVVKQQNRLNPS